MLKEYKIWALHQAIKGFNHIINKINESIILEADITALRSRIPNLKYLETGNKDNPGAMDCIKMMKQKHAEEENVDTNQLEKQALRDCLITAYNNEKNRLQSLRGEKIKDPPGIFVNQISHRVFNYDEVQDAITACIQDGILTCCDAVDVRKSLMDALKKLQIKTVETIFNRESNVLDLGPTKISKNMILSKIESIYSDKMNYLNGLSRDKESGCGDCGGRKPSGRSSTPPTVRSAESDRETRSAGGGRIIGGRFVGPGAGKTRRPIVAPGRRPLGRR